MLVVSGKKKAVSSTSGMQTSVKTSSLIGHRADVIVPARMKQMEEAILNRDFQTFGQLTMQVSLDNLSSRLLPACVSLSREGSQHMYIIM